MNRETLELDIRGQVCPSCLLMALKTVNQNHAALRSGRLLVTLLTDSRDATGTIPPAVESMGLVARVMKTSGHYRIEVSK